MGQDELPWHKKTKERVLMANQVKIIYAQANERLSRQDVCKSMYQHRDNQMFNPVYVQLQLRDCQLMEIKCYKSPHEIRLVN